jgi:hypothetical protein
VARSLTVSELREIFLATFKAAYTETMGSIARLVLCLYLAVTLSADDLAITE